MPVRPDRDITDPRMAKALAHPLRVRILGLLDDRVASPNELANEMGASLGVVSYHVRTLAQLGFLELVGKRQRRGATEHYYQAISRPVVSSEAWEKMPSVVKKAMVGAALGHVSDLVNLAAYAGGFERADAHLTRSALILDRKGFKEAAAKLDKLLEDLDRIRAASERRLSGANAVEEIRATAVLMLFETAPELETASEPETTPGQDTAAEPAPASALDAPSDLDRAPELDNGDEPESAPELEPAAKPKPAPVSPRE
jgi:DNA-binding transcriptional ArsR family regulator